MPNPTSPSTLVAPAAGDGRVPSGRGAAKRLPSRWSRWAPGAIVAVLAAGALFRFVSADTGDDGRVETRPGATASAADSVASLEQRVADDKNDLRARVLLGDAYLKRAIQTADPRFYDLAQRVLDEAAAIDPGDVATLVRRGGLALGRHDFEGALELGTTARRQEPDAVDPLPVVIDAQIELGRYDAAAESLQALLDIRPALPALARLSYLRQIQGDTPGAVLAMQQAESAGRSSPFDAATAAAFLGDLRFGSGQLDLADDAYGRALELSPELVLAELGQARVLDARGRRAEAIARLEELTERRPLPGALALLGDLQTLTGDAQGASVSYQLVRVASGAIADSGGVDDLEMSLFEADHGDPAAALDRAERAYGVRPTVYTADALAWALFRNGRTGEALPLTTEAGRQGTKDASFHYHTSEIMAALGDNNGAADHLATAAELNPWFSPAHAARAGALAVQLGVATPPAWV